MAKKKVIQPNKSEEERVEALLHGDVDTEDLPEARKTRQPVVVGLGASAGGLEPLSAFFGAMPPDTGLTFIVITHLSPDHESVLDELLQRYTAMPVRQVTAEQLAIEPNHVYVAPPNRQLVLTDQHIASAEFEGPRAGRAPIDIFFRSLAAVHSEPIAIVFSGGGSDGALGIRSVKEAGGLIMVQAPAEAAHDSMPRAAIATGVVDIVLPAHELAQRLVEINRRYVHVPTDPNKLSPEQHDALQRILTQLQSRTDHDFRAYKLSTVLRRVQRRMQITGFETLEGYLPFLRQSVDEAQALLGDLLIGVTNFFRDEESWKRLIEDVIPDIFAHRNRDEAVRVWSIGCSTGEEAYSLAILLLEYVARLDVPPQIQVFATDLDDGALSKAREGFYPDTIAADVSAERLQRFFTREGSYYRVRREVRDLVLFASHSVLRDPPFSHIDLLACRNLLIYLQRPLQDNLFEIFYYALKTGGYLFLGNAESADSAADMFATVDKKHRIYRAREWTGQSERALPTLPLMFHRPRTRFNNRAVSSRLRQELMDERSLYERVLEEFGPPTILVDEESSILRLSGTAGRYIVYPDGPPTNNLIRLVREELQFELRTGLFQAFDRGVATVSPPIPVILDGQEQRVYVSVRPRPGSDQRLALVVFVEDQDFARHAVVAPSDDDHNQGTVRQLEIEVRHLRERLQATVEEYETSNEELKAANEELQSINEEYRSTTEELETSKEELQSINEELETVNNELKAKLDEISRAHNDLQNLMSATEIGTLFLDRDLTVRHYTAGVESLFNIVRSDRGRPINHLTHNLDYPELIEDARRVLRTLAPHEREVAYRGAGSDAGQGWFLARMRPYRTIDDHIEGVVVTFVDITALKQVEAALRGSTERLQLALDSAQIGWQVIDPAGGALEQDGRARELAGFDADEPLALDKWLALVHPDDRDQLRDYLAAEDGRRFSLEYRIIRPDGQARIIQGTGIRQAGEDGRSPTVIGTLRDVTEQRAAEAELRRLTTELERRVAKRTAALEAANVELTAARDRFQALFNANPVPSVIIDLTDMTYVDANQAYLDYYGWTRDEVAGAPLDSRHLWPNAERRRRIIDHFRQAGKLVAQEYTILPRDGRERTVLATDSKIELDGRPCTLATFVDITARKQAEDKVRDLASQLTLAEQTERQRISLILHDDLQQRLYALQVHVAAVQARGQFDSATDLATLSEALTEMLAIVRHLSVDLAPPILQGESLYHSLVWLGSQLKAQYGLGVDVELVTPWRRVEEGLRILLFQVVRELLFNVVKHASVAEATVTIAQNNDEVSIEVRDGGAGFDNAEAAVAGLAGGQGLGMARRRIDLYGGRFDIDSQPGRGTTVTIVVPVAGLYV